MENIIAIKGKVKFPITIDPSVWIFDDRKAELHTFFEETTTEQNQLEEYTKSISKHWDREITEGATIPQQGKTVKKKGVKESLLTGTFGIPFLPFLQNSEPYDDAKFIKVHSSDQDYLIPIDKAKDLVFCFSTNGKPLKEDGPIYIYFKDGSNRNKPIKNVQSFDIQ
ncbi:peptidyl-prolyl cis-trans isomerase [Niallia sp. XMNu-256]|uniref:peptidyl-prolyl cis-trans isomerase n=1 Tax=Niallia sp. XMNu-256 TaxID=3082444 RepID=UPI0030D012E5